jgi:hypothetical protein
VIPYEHEVQRFSPGEDIKGTEVTSESAAQQQLSHHTLIFVDEELSLDVSVANHHRLMKMMKTE